MDDAAIDWWKLEEGQNQPLPRDERGQVRSQVFPGLWIDTAALLRGDMSAALTFLQNGLASAEHQAFVEQPSRAKKT